MRQQEQILRTIIKINKRCSLTISGTSMFPILQDKQKVQIELANAYALGDILVYTYKNEGLLAHRLLRIDNKRYFCKGDNSFRIEDITEEQIIGRIVLDNDPHKTLIFVEASAYIGNLFRKCGYKVDKIKSDPMYLTYKREFLEKKDDQG